MSPLPVLYSFRRCPYAMRARMSLIASGTQCELREVDLGNKPATMLEASPKATVPVLQLTDGTVLHESLDIMLWALKSAGPGRWLTPSGGSMSDMLRIIEGNDGAFKYHLDRYKYPNRFADEINGDARTHRLQASGCLAPVEIQLSKTPFLFGEHLSLADIAILPFVRQFAATDPEWFASLDYTHVQQWLQHWQQSSLFTACMGKHPLWQPGDAPEYLLDVQE
ncbi:MAG: glutathione S-transferase [Mariprofundaceae bacterium]|nr:glutathione S-transferase [Mariprofundaceae bacterium]